jgi:hypothetical protein
VPRLVDAIYGLDDCDSLSLKVFCSIKGIRLGAVPVHKLSLEEYLELDKNSGVRYEYFDGEVVAMSGANLS